MIKKPQIIGLIIICFLTLSFSINAECQNKKIIIKGDKNYPPYEFINEKGELEGYNIELIKALMAEMKSEYDIELMDWGEATKLLTERKIDMLTGAAFSVGRLENFNFSSPNCYIRQTLVYRKGDKVGVDNLIDKQLVVQNNTLAYSLLKDAGISERLVVVDDIYEGLDLLSAGRYDVVLCEENLIKYFIKNNNIRNLDYSIINDIKPVPYCFAVNKDNKELLASVNNAFENIRAKGIYDSIYYKWFGPYQDKKGLSFIWKIVLILISILLFLALCVIFIVRMQVRRGTRKLKDLNDELELALYAGKVNAWVYDIENENIKKLYGSSISLADELLLKELIMNIHSDDIQPLMDALNNLSSGKEKEASIRIRLINDKVEGGYSYLESEMMAVRSSGTKIKYLIATEKDVTNDFLYKKELQESKKRAEMSDKLKSAFLANMSHEIRTPLSSILGFAELISTTENEKEKEEYKKIMKYNSEKLLNLIENIFSLSKIESGDVELNNSEFDFVHLMNDIKVRYDYLVEKPDIKFSCINPYKRCIVSMDREKIDKIILNFLSNALKYTSEGEITLSYSYENDGIKVMVKDTGVGMEEDKQKNVFDHFQRVNNFISGTGLGLSICKGYVEAMGGKIGVESQFGNGSSFWFHIPCKADLF